MLYFLTEKKQKRAYKNMSQAKVDRYKEEKKNRKQTHQEREKKPCAGTYVRCSHCSSDRMLDRIFRIFLLSGEKPMTKTELSMTALNEYMSNLSSTDSATE